MTEQELWEGLHEIERRGPTEEARALMRDLLGRMDHAELAVMARAVARTITPEELAAMDPEDARLWGWWRRQAVMRDGQGKAPAETEGGAGNG